MKPDYRTITYPLPHTAAAARSGAETTPTPHPLRWIGARMVAWWRDHQRQRDERLRLEALAPLDRYLLRDIGLSDELRSHALAQR